MENTYCIDWLSFTIKLQNEKDLGEDFLQDIFENLLLNELDLEFLQSFGRYGYNSKYSFNNIINIYYNEIHNKYDNLEYFLNQGIHIELSGSGCRLLESVIKNWKDYFNLILKNYNVNFSRIDIALDDYNELLNFNVVERKIKKGEIISRSKKRDVILDINNVESISHDGKQKSRTFYFGSRKSDVFLRFYDKKLEMLSKGKKCDFKTWQRYEIVLKKIKANSFVNNFLKSQDQDLGKLYRSIISGLLRFVDKKGVNKSDWPTSKFWNEFLENTETIELAFRKINTNIESTVDWINKSVVSSLLFINDILKTENKNVFEILKKSKRDRKIKHEQAFQLFQKLEKEQKEEIIKKIENIAKK